MGSNSRPLCSQSELLPLHQRGLLLTVAKLQALIPSVSCFQFHVFLATELWGMKLDGAKGYLLLVSCFWIYLGDSLHVSCFVLLSESILLHVSCFVLALVPSESILLSNPLAPVTCFLFLVLMKTDRTKKRTDPGGLELKTPLLPHQRGLLLTIAKLRVLIPSVSCFKFHVFWATELLQMKLDGAKGYLFLVSCFWIYLGDSLQVSCFVFTFQEAFCYMFRVSC